MRHRRARQGELNVEGRNIPSAVPVLNDQVAFHPENRRARRQQACLVRMREQLEGRSRKLREIPIGSRSTWVFEHVKA